MPSMDGSGPSQGDDPFHEKLDPELVNRLFVEALEQQATTHMVDVRRRLKGTTVEEQDRIADGEPYCFRCGRPASSFPEYDYSVREGFEVDGADRADYVRNEEGTYNPDTNRFACDECYIAIGTPSAVGGWKAP